MHLVAVLVHLDPDAVELAVDGDLGAVGPALASASATSAALDASIGRTGRPRLQPERRQRVDATGRARPAATGSVEPASIDARRTAAAGTPAAAATASSTSPSSAPCRSSPVTSPRR